MSIKALHIPHDEQPVAEVTVDERNAMSYYPFVEGGPVEAGHLTFDHLELVCYVNSRYAMLDEDAVNSRATQLFDMAGVGMFGGSIRGDALLVVGAGGGDYERSMPAELIAIFLNSDEGAKS